MADSSASLLEESIAQLERLSAQLAGDVPSNSRSMTVLPRRVLLCKETLLTISVLLPKLRAVRAARESGRAIAARGAGFEE